jgi:hypothetical protein
MRAVYTERRIHCRIPAILSVNSVGILNARTLLRQYVRGLAHNKHWNPARQSFPTEGFLLVVACTIDTRSADQHNHIGIRRGATSFNTGTSFIPKRENFEKSQE